MFPRSYFFGSIASVDLPHSNRDKKVKTMDLASATAEIEHALDVTAAENGGDTPLPDHTPEQQNLAKTILETGSLKSKDKFFYNKFTRCPAGSASEGYQHCVTKMMTERRSESNGSEAT